MITEYDLYVGKCGKFRLQKFFLKNGGLLPQIKTGIIDDYDTIVMCGESRRTDIEKIKLKGLIILVCVAKGLGVIKVQEVKND